MRRVLIFDRQENLIGELSESEILSLVMREEINGEHSLEIVTTQVIEKGSRIYTEASGSGGAREFAVSGIEADHSVGYRPIYTYYCPWSMQEDLQGVIVSVMPGVQSPVSAHDALTALLSTQDRWTPVVSGNSHTGGASMYDMTAWEALSVLVENWVGEVDSIVIRGVNKFSRWAYFYGQIGSSTPVRRFDFGADIEGIKRILPDTPYYCRISPRGKGEQIGDGYGRKITIESVNGGKDYLTYSAMVDTAKLYDSDTGSYIYPTLIVENGDCETPAELKTWAQSVLADYCTPKVTYEIDVLNVSGGGVDVEDLVLGDTVQVVDRYFGDDGLQLQGRVIAKTTDLLNERDVQITIGDIAETLSAKFKSTSTQLSSVKDSLDYKLDATELSSSFAITSHTLNAAAEIAQNAIVSGTTTVEKDGYYPIGIVGYNTGNRYCYFTTLYLSTQSSGSGVVTWTMCNRTANTMSPTSSCRVLWVKE